MFAVKTSLLYYVAMKTIVVTSTRELWEEAKKLKKYTNSTIDSKLEDVGFIHATNPSQTIEMLNRHFTNRDDILLLLVDLKKVHPEVKFEKPLSGSAGMYPHIYGELNVDAVYDELKPNKDIHGRYEQPKKLISLADKKLNRL